MKDFFKAIGLVALIFIVAFLIGASVKSCNSGLKATHIEDATVVYEDFQQIYNTCEKLNTDLGNMQSLDEKDPMFSQFSKAQRINTLKTQLNKWVEEYNAKSKMWGRSKWKSDQLPYELNINQFSNYK